MWRALPTGVALVLVGCLVGLARAADSPPVERLSLDTCIARALEAAPELAEARAEVDIRRSKLAEAKLSRYLPDAEAVSATGFAPRARGNVVSSPDSVTTREFGPFTRVEVEVHQPLYTWGKIAGGIAAATRTVEQQMAATEARAADVVMQVKQLFYNALLARSVLGVVDRTADAYDTALKTATKRRERGDPEISEIDLLNFRIAVAEVAKDVPRLKAGEQGAIEALLRLMGDRSSGAVDLAPTLLEPDPAEVKPLEYYDAELFRRNPSWREVSAGVEAKGEEVKTVEADFYPMVFLLGAFGYGYAPERRRQTNPFVNDQYNFLNGPGAALGVRWGLSFHVTAARVATARAELERIEAARRSARRGLPVELHDAYRRVQENREALVHLDDGRRAGRAVLTLAVTNFDLGLDEPRKVFDALGLYAKVSSDYYETVRDYNVAVADIQRIVTVE